MDQTKLDYVVEAPAESTMVGLGPTPLAGKRGRWKTWNLGLRAFIRVQNVDLLRGDLKTRDLPADQCFNGLLFCLSF